MLLLNLRALKKRSRNKMRKMKSQQLVAEKRRRRIRVAIIKKLRKKSSLKKLSWAKGFRTILKSGSSETGVLMVIGTNLLTIKYPFPSNLSLKRASSPKVSGWITPMTSTQ
jgi:hypothetical protein